MNRTLLALLVGLIPLYFLDAAFKLSTLHPELLVHSAFRFVISFFLMGIGVFYSQMLKLKSALYIALALVLADDIWDYMRSVDSFKPEVMIHSVYMLLWGAVVGYVLMQGRQKHKEP